MNKHMPAECFPPGEFLRDELNGNNILDTQEQIIKGDKQ